MDEKPRNPFIIAPAVRKLLEQHGADFPMSKLRDELRALGYQFDRRHLTAALTRLREQVREAQAEKWKPVIEQMKQRGTLPPEPG